MSSTYIGTNILLTTSGVLAPEAVEAAVLTAGEDAVMFSVDYPFESTADAVASIEKADLSEAGVPWFELSIVPFGLAIPRYSLLLDSGQTDAAEIELRRAQEMGVPDTVVVPLLTVKCR